MVVNAPFDAVEVQWKTPSDISTQGATLWNKIRIYRSGNESSGYQLVNSLDQNVTADATFTADPTNTVNVTAHGYSNGDLVGFSTDGELPSTLSVGVCYYARNVTANTLQVSESSDTAILTFPTAGTGTHKLVKGLLHSEIDSQLATVWVTNWDDTTTPMSSKDGWYYLVRYYDTSTDSESKYYLTWKSPDPKEARFIKFVRTFVTPWVSQFLEDDDIRGGIILAMNYINMQPPQTSFTLANFPTIYEPLLTMGAGIFTLMFKYLNIAITDFNYSDMGLSLNVDRGSKVQQAIDNLMGMYQNMLALAKMDFASGGRSVGTVQLPIGLGGNIQRGIMNVLDIFTSVGR